ncbi:MAG: 3-oxoacyl-ACP synthase [Kordia sp.]|nr:MAG: 3-oxoacyl-ACP synthase [Kordia sp.]
MTVKEQLYEECKKFLLGRLNSVIGRIDNIQESLQSETKSSAGDKHETGRAMLQLEREKAGNQLADIQKQQELFSRVVIDTSSDVARLGSIIITDKGAYFLAISAGAIVAEGNTYYAISPSSPIGKILLGKKNGVAFVFNGIRQQIMEIL